MSVADVKKSTDLRMQKSLETLRADLAKVRTGRPIPAFWITYKLNITAARLP